MELKRFPIKADSKRDAYLFCNKVNGSIPWADAIVPARRWYRHTGSASESFEAAMYRLATTGGLTHHKMDSYCCRQFDNMATKWLEEYDWRKNFIASDAVPEAAGAIEAPTSFSEAVLYSTVRIETTGINLISNSPSSGAATGFVYNFGEVKDSSCYVITNKHVFSDAITATLNFPVREKKGDSSVPTGGVFPYSIPDIAAAVINHPDEDIDLCAIALEPIEIAAAASGKELFALALNSSMIPTQDSLNLMPVIQDVFMYGYPIGLWDTFNNLPIIRKGVLASHPALNFCGQPLGAIDIASFPGSSGSPIFILSDGGQFHDKHGHVWTNRHVCILVGIMSRRARMYDDGTMGIAAIPVQHQNIEDPGMLPIHLGYYIKSSELWSFLHALPSANISQ